MEDIDSILVEKAKVNKISLVVAEGWDERCLKAAADIIKDDLMHVILLGDPDTVKKKAGELNLDISKAEILDYKRSDFKEELAEKLYELRKHKGMTIEKARELLEDENYFACMYVNEGYADAVAGSAICPTADLMRPALQILRKPQKTVSEVSVLEDVKNDRILFITDGSLNVDPTPEQLKDMALNAAETVESFNMTPRIALLSYSTKGSGGMSPEIQKVLDAVKLALDENPELIVDAEYQFDAAVNPKAAARKCPPDAKIKGDANTLVFPNLTAANIFFHGILQLSDVNLKMGILKGMKKPVVILGRSSPVGTIKTMMLSCAL